MFVTTALTILIMLMIWHTNVYLVLAFLSIFGSIELVYLSANVYKFDQGGWLPIAFASLLGALMLVWHDVTSRKYRFETENKVSMASLAGRLENEAELTRVPGMGLMYTQLVDGVPPVFDMFAENLRALHSVLVFVSVKHLPISSVPEGERFLVRRVGGKRSYRMYRVVVRYGYWEAPIGHESFEALVMESLEKMIVQGERRLESAEMVNGVPATDRGDRGEEDCEEEMIDEASLATSVPNREDEAIVEEELGFIRRAREEGVTYMLGNSVVEASKDASLVKKIIVDGIYHALQLVSRRSRAALEIPHKHLVEVGITYTI
jgi:KUP system potassium uptake protein